MSLNFEIQPAANPTPEKERSAKLADPGFGRIFTDHMAIIRYNQAKGWHDARVESRANFPLDPATADGSAGLPSTGTAGRLPPCCDGSSRARPSRPGCLKNRL